MKKIHLLATLGLILIFAACSGDSAQKDAPEVSTDTETTTFSDPPATNNPAANVNATAGNTAVVHHYICPNNCEGSGGAAAGNCPVCGTAYTHNTAYHQQNNASNNTNAQTTPPQFEQNANAQQPQIEMTPPPAKNEAGVYHYICAAGCEGGAAKAGTCSNCGGELTHNTAYHQN